MREFVASYPKSEAVTQSAFDLASLTEVQRTADELGTLLAKAYAKGDFAVTGAISDARSRAQGYDHPDYVDLHDFCGRLAKNFPASARLAKKVQDAIAACVFANGAPNAKVAGSSGLSIYLPWSKVSPLYQNLDFAKGGWGKFLAARSA